MDLKAGLADQSVNFAAWTTATGAPVTVTKDTAGLSLWYRRGVAGVKVPLTLVTTPAVNNLATLDAAHTDAGILVIEGAEHRFDLPDAACAAGALTVSWGGSATGITIDGGTANLIGQANTATDLMHWEGTAPLALSAGYYVQVDLVTIKTSAINAPGAGTVYFPTAAYGAASGPPLNDAAGLLSNLPALFIECPNGVDIAGTTGGTYDGRYTLEGYYGDEPYYRFIKGGAFLWRYQHRYWYLNTALDGLTSGATCLYYIYNSETGSVISSPGYWSKVSGASEIVISTPALVAADVTNWKTAAAPAMTGDAFASLGSKIPQSITMAQIGGTGDFLVAVDAKAVGGTTQTGRDLGTSVLISSGTSTGQLSVASGVVAASGNWNTTTPPTAAAIATAVWQDSTAGDLNVASSIGKSLYTSGNVPGAASGLSIVGSAMTVPDTQKVDVNTVKTKAVTCAAALAVGAYVGGTAAAALETTAQSIKLKTDLLTSGKVTISSPVSLAGDRLTFVQGADYTVASGAPVEFDDPGEWPSYANLAAGVLTLKIISVASGATLFSVTGSAVDGDTVKVRFQPTHTETALLTTAGIGVLRFSAKAVLADVALTVVPLVYGDGDVIEG